MNYLARLKQLDNGEIFHHAPKPEPTKPTEPPFDGFVGSIPGANENIYSENQTAKAEQSAEAFTSYRWLVHFADREPVEVFTHPDADFARMMREYPNALAAEPLPEPPRPATSCTTCTNSRKPGSTRFCCARADLSPAYGDGHPLRQLPDDGGDGCGQWIGR